MQKDSIAIGCLTLLMTAAIVGGAWYEATNSTDMTEGLQEPTWAILLPSGEPAAGNATQPIGVPAEISRTRTNWIIEFKDFEISKIYTSTASCYAADVHNRWWIAEPLIPTTKPQCFRDNGYQIPALQAETVRKKSKPAKSREFVPVLPDVVGPV